MFREIVHVAVELQFSIGKEGKNVTIIYPVDRAVFDPTFMEDVNDRRSSEKAETSSIGASDVDMTPTLEVPANEPPRTVLYCIGFGFQGSAGIEQKCQVVLA